MVHVIFVRELQRHMQDVTEMPEGIASRESRIFARASMATGVVSEGFRLLSTMHERNESRR